MSREPRSGVAVAQPSDPDELATVKRMFEEYAQSLSFSLGFQGFAQEMADFPGRYAPPGGVLLLARAHRDGAWQAAGAVGLRALDAGTCEMKRMYVRDGLRGLGVGRALALAAIEHGRACGYRRMRLDTIHGQMDSAEALYRSLGFHDIAAYYDNPVPGAVYLERDLRA